MAIRFHISFEHTPARPSRGRGSAPRREGRLTWWGALKILGVVAGAVAGLLRVFHGP